MKKEEEEAPDFRCHSHADTLCHCCCINLLRFASKKQPPVMRDIKPVVAAAASSLSLSTFLALSRLSQWYYYDIINGSRTEIR